MHIFKLRLLCLCSSYKMLDSLFRYSSAQQFGCFLCVLFQRMPKSTVHNAKGTLEREAEEKTFTWNIVDRDAGHNAVDVIVRYKNFVMLFFHLYSIFNNQNGSTQRRHIILHIRCVLSLLVLCLVWFRISVKFYVARCLCSLNKQWQFVFDAKLILKNEDLCSCFVKLCSSLKSRKVFRAFSFHSFVQLA